MSRRHASIKREIKPDMRYNSVLLAKFQNNVMKEGKKAVAEKIIYGAFERIEKQHKVNPYETFMNALNNVKPYLEVTSVRVGGANYQVPSTVEERRGYALSMRWIITAAEKRSERTMIEKLAAELNDAANNKGGAIKKKDDVYRMAEANKAFSHFSPKKKGGK